MIKTKLILEQYLLDHYILDILYHTNKYIINTQSNKYFEIIGINAHNLINIDNENYVTEVKSMVKKLFQYPRFAVEIYSSYANGVSKIDFLDKFSPEQVKYITNLDINDTKLIACAGSGKTRSIIGRVKFIVEHGLADKEEVYAITFSKHAAMDFHRRIKDLFPDFENFCVLKNFSTIDSLAKSILCRVKYHRSDNVEILSIALRNYLRNITPEDIKVISEYKNIKHLFIDEAQDLNEIQYDIAILLKKYFGTQIHLCGDPNQNIYQFRRSCNSYLLNFPAKKYELTLNFRSTNQIINFSEDLKPIETSRSKSATNLNGPKVVIVTKPASHIHTLILSIIKWYGKTKDLSNIAIICPTRGIGSNNNAGLSVIFNFLKINNIAVNQLYTESGLSDDRKKNSDRIPNHVNLLTYHGTKGLEFDIVFVMDFYHMLYNIPPSVQEHDINRYLLYVATSRAINTMYICTYTNNFGGYLNHWITKVNPNNYVTDNPLKIPKLSFRDSEKLGSGGITDLIGELSDEQLFTIYNYLDVREYVDMFTTRIYPDYTTIDRGKDEALFGIFCEELFYLAYYLSKQLEPRKFIMIEHIIDAKFVVVKDDSEKNTLNKYVITSKMTWEEYDKIKNNMPSYDRNLIEKYLSREKSMDDSIVCTNEFIKIIEPNIPDIKKTYDKYLNAKSYQYNYDAIILDFFYLIVVQYAYNINHYIYICDHGKDKQYLVENGRDLFQEIYKYVSCHYSITTIDPKIIVKYSKMMLCGEIDFIEHKSKEIETIVEIKCVNEISIKYYVQLLLYNFCYYLENKQIDKLFNNGFKIINLLTGLEHRLIIEISPENMFNLLIILADVGNLSFNNFNLVYDLETTDRIKRRGPFIQKPIIPRSDVYQIKSQYYATVYPEIIEIAVRDYDTGMVLINTLVKPTSEIKFEVQKITKIKPTMLLGKPNIDNIRTILTNKMKNFQNYVMLAHNGSSFDNKIMTYYNLVDSQKVSYIDTMSIIPLHLPYGIKLDSKKLSNIYYKLFGKKFVAHRAMNDVDALVRIMKYLKIDF
ncbi:putative ATP-dependent DNA helicase [Powai lake megavirus]|uniref:DNA 3'-5' helicase n=1 Tax=Powai lake megavirus TaxID=1842663 RepID=A0A167RKC9_9VIRU|nr:putative ATP-dependent DNA helicase [Powai lake megavirus]ANB50789.1 putative ATP-dependent DNA helicase [Powai lake megavirus]WBF70583.1 putative ATP-dependent DNA helicase [Megavirus caiporensis]